VEKGVANNSRSTSCSDRYPWRRVGRFFRQTELLCSDLHDALHGVQLLGYAPPRALDLVASFGERLSALIIAGYLGRFRRAQFVDAREIIVTDAQFTNAHVIFPQTNRAIRRYFAKLFPLHRRAPIAVVTGFVAATPDGQTITLGRNGSDYSAAILGAALNASVIEIWTDVGGVLSADPRDVPSAFVLPEVSYEEAMELLFRCQSASLCDNLAGCRSRDSDIDQEHVSA
jgi:bifunctional aspartokinase / homoserine dehydrogenase 1